METLSRGRTRWRELVYAHMLGTARPQGWLRCGLGLLRLLSYGYGAVAAMHRLSFAWGLRTPRRLPCRVVSVGNLTLGGTGKTPLTMWIARWYQQQGWRVAILSRGYGAGRPADCRIISTGAGPLVDWQVAGDEPYLLARVLPGVAVLTGKDRYRSGRYACEHLGAQVVILDDGFQHRPLQRDLDIVLVDASNPFGAGYLLPRGILREPPPALQRADIIVLSRPDMSHGKLAILHQQLHTFNPRAPHYTMTITPIALSRYGSDATLPVTWLRQRRVVAFSGIGNPAAFLATLAQCGAEVVTSLVFPDHHPYTVEDWQAMVAIGLQRQAACLITTAKDAVRLTRAMSVPLPLYTLHIDVALATDDLGKQLQALLS